MTPEPFPKWRTVSEYRVGVARGFDFAAFRSLSGFARLVALPALRLTWSSGPTRRPEAGPPKGRSSPALRLVRSSGQTRRPRDAAARPRQPVRRNPVFVPLLVSQRRGRPPRPGLGALLFSKREVVSQVDPCLVQPYSHYLWGRTAVHLEPTVPFTRSVLITSVTLSQATRCGLLLCRLSSCTRASHEAAVPNRRESGHGDSVANGHNGLPRGQLVLSDS